MSHQRQAHQLKPIKTIASLSAKMYGDLPSFPSSLRSPQPLFSKPELLVGYSCGAALADGTP
ncbi:MULTISPECIES: hypothetical protein [unclassified Coleofasciculus]|uniref:hypothetical protein n=1 Tax=unclassified Coleofasciculus TaxID=2692782 RepID=UPI00188252D5|nr:MULTISPECIES: hypothetical protein [unclassified Coleofasciculus]MBE9127124.1 hypothetical protein [Coleofasciculus sp. LEGE 07081]MBE9149769.1 hypothetical protein [Coleofasciculus sp. LEGE 07092]